jgi:hypothetical protein
MTSFNIIGVTNTTTGLLRGSYILPSPDNSHKIASAYQYATTPFQMEMITLRRDSGADAYHKFASTNWEYKAYVGWKGGKPPFRVTLLEYPSGATVGASGFEQTMTRTLDAIGGGVYAHTQPAEANTIRWQPLAGDVGQTRKFKILIEDSTGAQKTNTHYVTTGESKFVYADINAADDTGAGTWAAPKKTFNAAHNNAGKICVYKTAGSYLVTFGGLNNTDEKVRNHIAIVDGVEFGMTLEQFGCSSASDDVAFVNITFRGVVPTESNVNTFKMSGKTQRALWWGCKWRDITLGTVATDNSACINIRSLGNPPDTDSFGRGAYLNLPSTHSHFDIAVVQCDVDATVDSQQFVGFSLTRCLTEFNTANYKPEYVTVGGNNNGGNWLHFKDSVSQVTVRFNVCSEGGFLTSGILFSNQRGFYCDEQEALFNTTKWSQGSGISWNRQALYAGLTELGQRVGATNTRCIRNTFIHDGAAQLEFLRWNEMTDIADPVIFEGNLVATTAANILTATTLSQGGYTDVGVNQKLAASDFDVQLKLTDSARGVYLGKQGAEIASTLVN